MPVKDTLFYKKKSVNCNGKMLLFDEPKLMAVINITPDSFYSGSRFFTEDRIREHLNLRWSIKVYI